MNFWKLVAAIVAANLLTGILATVLWLLFIASLFSGSLNGGADAERNVEAYQNASYRQVAEPSQPDVRTWPSARGRKLSAPDANGCIKELAAEAGGHC